VIDLKKRNLRIISSGFSYGAVIGMLLFLINTPPDSVLPQTLKILLVAVICALVSGIVITGVLFLVEFFRAKIYAPYRTELATEGEILLEDTASRLVNDTLVKGWLFLTPKTLAFFSSQKEQRRIPVSDISEIQISDAKKGQITVSTTSMESEVFSVSDALAWFNAVGDLSK
jgi:hypothetical protein